MAKTQKDGWIESGLVLLRDGGQDALTIARLCEALGRTKGSFYHHFTNIEAYREELLDAWERNNTRAPMTQANRATTGGARRRALGEAVRQLDSQLDLAVRAWGLRDAVARDYVVRVDELRIGYLADIMPENLPRSRRLLLARLEYAAFLGNQQLDPSFSRADSKRVERLLNQALGWLGKQG